MTAFYNFHNIRLKFFNKRDPDLKKKKSGQVYKAVCLFLISLFKTYNTFSTIYESIVLFDIVFF